MWVVSTAISYLPISTELMGRGRARRVVEGDGFNNRSCNQSWVGQEVVEEGCGGGTDKAGDEVDRHVLRPEGRTACDLLHQLGTESTRGVERRAGDGAEDEDDPDDRAADHDPCQLCRRLRVDDAEDREDEQPGADRLGEAGLEVGAGRRVSGKVPPG